MNFGQKVIESEAFEQEMTSPALSEAGRREAMEVFLRQAKIYAKAGQWNEVCMACHDAITAAPDLAEVHKLVGNIYQAFGQGAEALGYYGRALLANPTFPEIYANLGSFYARQQAWEDAERYYRQAIALRPDFAPFYRPLALVLEALGKGSEAKAIFAQAVALDPEASGAEHYLAGNCFLAQGEERKAIQSYRRAVESEEGCLEACQPLADLLEKQGDWQAATLYYRKVFEAGLTQRPGAIAHNDRTRGSGPVSDAPVAHATLSRDAEKDGPHERGQNSSNPAADNGYGVTRIPAHRRRRAGQFQSSRLVRIVRSSASQATGQAPARGLTIAPRPSPSVKPSRETGQEPAPAELGNLAEPSQAVGGSGAAVPSQQAWQMTITNCQAALAENPNQPAVYRDLALALDRAQRSEEAAQAWYQALRLEPSWASPKQHCQLGDRLAKRGKGEEATVCYKLAIRQDAQFTLAYEQLARLLERQGDVAGAIAIYRQALEKGSPPPPSPTPSPASLGVNAALEAATALRQSPPTDAQWA